MRGFQIITSYNIALLLYSIVNSSHALSAANWIRTAEISRSDDGTQTDSIVLNQYPVSPDLASSRSWLEHWEEKHRQEGSYTVLRCDISGGISKIWGLDFHLDRLQKSFEVLQTVECQESWIIRVHNAREKSEGIVKALVKSFIEQIDEGYCGILMVALLWTPICAQGNGDGTTIETKVQGHGAEIQISRPGAIDATIALENSAKNNLPRRYDQRPASKLSGWCSRRRPIETIFKTEGIGEVFLTRTDGINMDVEILEGLTSNLFVIMDDGTLRSAPNDVVLGGYVRSLILSGLADMCGLKLDLQAPTLSDLKMGRWRGAFITSSIRLFVPVERIFTRGSDESDLVELWSSQDDCSSIIEKLRSLTQ